MKKQLENGMETRVAWGLYREMEEKMETTILFGVEGLNPNPAPPDPMSHVLVILETLV